MPIKLPVLNEYSNWLMFWRNNVAQMAGFEAGFGNILIMRIQLYRTCMGPTISTKFDWFPPVWLHIPDYHHLP